MLSFKMVCMWLFPRDHVTLLSHEESQLQSGQIPALGRGCAVFDLFRNCAKVKVRWRRGIQLNN